MGVPQHPKKMGGEVIITPRQHFEAEKGAYLDFDPPSAVILCFESSLMDTYKASESTSHERFWTGEIIYLNKELKDVALVGNFGIGGPAAAHMLEILISVGVSNFVVVGHAGGLKSTNLPGTLVLSDKSVRDEGLSYHYLERGYIANASAEMSRKLEQQLKKKKLDYVQGSSWTLDSMYRETKEEVRKYAAEGVVTVEMELASLFAVATFRKVQIGALLVISDYVGLDHWEEHLKDHSTRDALTTALEVAREALAG